jgi:hypothetical protein
VIWVCFKPARNPSNLDVCLASTTQQYQEFMFLQGISFSLLSLLLTPTTITDTIPSPLPLSEALQRREAKEKEMLEEDPAMASSAQVGPNSANHLSQKGKSRSRAVNGKEKPNGNTNNPKRERKSRDGNGRWSYSLEDGDGSRGGDGSDVAWRASNWPNDQSSFRPSPLGAPLTSVSASYLPDREVDGNEHHPQTSREQQAGYSTLQSNQPPYPSDEEGWPGMFTGPASAFLQPNGPFGRIPQNPGRTIYSQRNDPGTFR